MKNEKKVSEGFTNRLLTRGQETAEYLGVSAVITIIIKDKNGVGV